MSLKGSLVGSIVERKAGAPAAAPTSRPTSNGGFPGVQHRSKSAFQRAREGQKSPSTTERPPAPPSVAQPRPTQEDDEDESRSSRVIAEATEDWRRQMEDENQKRVEAMTDEERDAERREILERFGPNIGEVLRKARLAREAAGRESTDERMGRPRTDSKVLKSALASRAASPTPLSTTSSRPPSRAERQIRFADVTTKDVHVYESAPPSPKRKPLALMSPTDTDGPTISLGEFKGRLVPNAEDPSPATSPMAVDSPVQEKPLANGGPVEGVTKEKPLLLPSTEAGSPLKLVPDAQEASPATSPMFVDTPVLEKQRSDSDFMEGTPEDIRRRFFPNAAPHDPSLAWIEGPSNAEPDSISSTLRFDLAGRPISAADAEKLPTHLGLHHHAEGRHAGYTLDDIFLLSRSTVPAQRASMLDVLSKIARQLSNTARERGTNVQELAAQEDDLRKRMLAAGLEAMAERGTVGIRAVDLIWACVVFWDEAMNDVDGIELKSAADDILSSLPMESVLTQISDALQVAALPHESLFQLLEVLHRLAKHSNDVASAIIGTPKLLAAVMRRFVLLPPVPEDTQHPEPEALRLLDTLAQSSRANASAIAESASALLRFAVTLPNASLYPAPLATGLLSGTLRVYVSLARYGLCAQLATTAAEPLGALGAHLLGGACTLDSLREAFLALREAWTTAARDPHRTQPSHDILWSQIAGWGWGSDILQLRTHLEPSQTRLWAALWRAEAAWLEGAAVNVPKGGEAEKRAALEALGPDFAEGKAKVVVAGAVAALEIALAAFAPDDIARTKAWRMLAEPAGVLSAALRLWLASLPSQTTPLSAPPFSLPFAEISTLCARLTLHPLWASVRTKAVPAHVLPLVRPLSLLLAVYLDFSRFLPGAADDLWLAQAFTIALRLVPGDEERGVHLLERSTTLVSPTFMESRGWQVPPGIWESKGLESIAPFLTFALQNMPEKVAPLWPTPASLPNVTALRLSAPLPESMTHATTSLPLNRDWMSAPLDHLLRSGQSEVFAALPQSWDFSETEIVRAALLLAKVHRETLVAHGLPQFALNREETVFALMKVFMLEHGQQENSAEEVFRDAVVGRFMEDLLAPFSFAAAQSLPAPAAQGPSLEDIAKPFLGAGTPFYQYYTDFAGLYDAVSFGHALFGRLLLPPLAMRYPSDFRRCLYADFPQALRTLHIQPSGVPSSDLREFLWPAETDAEVLAAYLRALVKGLDRVAFVYWLALHHIACNVWPDLGHVVAGERPAKLLRAIVAQAGPEVVRDVVTYCQTRDVLVLPPACFEGVGEVKDARRTAAQLAGDDVRERLAALLE
ncbi:hypothetical protein PsYK624_087160 [Phanerochaete sordida]|uniref:RNA polymerase II-associated protein 1 C-terminal domain-containing protein n=1 Tax=Phanerochaete sordida TaxID=48140 RepID=A0A9P3LEI4_9APHY|nr:hypothetical protein PsYK624_087160 [Phanerochaete sordida]